MWYRRICADLCWKSIWMVNKIKEVTGNIKQWFWQQYMQQNTMTMDTRQWSPAVTALKENDQSQLYCILHAA